MTARRIVTVIGARPQFIKAAALSRLISAQRQASQSELEEILVHTGQHYDDDMSDVFFAELGLPAPKVNLAVGSGPHGAQTGEMMKQLEPILCDFSPDVVVVYGDTNTTLAGALVAAKLNIPVAHVEAGLRSWRRTMPEEVNRVVVDHLSSMLFCPSVGATENLGTEGVLEGVHLVGDVMYDVLIHELSRVRTPTEVLAELGIAAGEYALATIHRAENTDSALRLAGIMDGLIRVARAGLRVVLPLHPRTRRSLGTRDVSELVTTTPLSYQQMLALEAGAHVLITDSGGAQKEAFWLGVPCVTLREETEWPETVDSGWNVLVGADSEKIGTAAQRRQPVGTKPAPYGDGNAAARILQVLKDS